MKMPPFSWRRFLILIAIGLLGSFLAGFIGGWLFARPIIFLAAFGCCVLFSSALKTGKWWAFMLFMPLLFLFFFPGEAGMKIAPLGRNARLNAADIIEKSKQHPENGKAVSDEIDRLLERESNWFQSYEFELEKARNNSLAAYSKYKSELERKNAESARIRRDQQITDGSYIPSEFEVGRACKELARSNSLTRRVEWGFLGIANSKWFPDQKTIILEGTSKNGFGVDMPFSIECRWEKGGIVRVVEIN
ncbi:hypothetical protein [Cyanobium sp. Lug-B]|uniref:hypothetical protein n=1 Tax=Cyanobium sp. Lug-B TaxID=2823716 RepID=UPI0020CF50AD|nr:hypothetical protein [Cyanobium sp. Lug-B]